MRISQTSWCVVVLLVIVAGATRAFADADWLFIANLTGSQQVPPSGSAATGEAVLRISLSGNNFSMTGSFSGLGSNQTAAHIHGPAGPGGVAPILFTLTSAGTTTGSMSGFGVAITPTQAADGRAGLWYVDVHSVGLPGGEIRGQLLPEPAFVAVQDGAQVVPAVATDRIGTATVSLNPARTKAYITLRYQGFTGGTTGVHVHGPARPGTDGPIIFTLSASDLNANLTFSNFSFALTPALLAQLRAGLLYVDVHSAAHPAGEIRGQLKPANKAVDFDADSRGEIGVFRPSTGIWYLQNPATNAFSARQFGASGDSEVPADYDGDGKSDFAVFRPSTGIWYILGSSDGSFLAQPFGTNGDIATPADYDGDGRADLAVYRPGSPQGYLYILQSSNNVVRTVPWGTTGDTSLVGDFDGDRKADVAIYRIGTGTYWILRSSDSGVVGQQWGVFSTDWISSSDYDGDGTTDIAVFRFGGSGGDAGTWYILQSTTGTLRAQPFGTTSDQSQPADYDGDGLTDLAVTRNAAGVRTWYVLRSSTGTLLAVTFGLSTDVPVARYLIR